MMQLLLIAAGGALGALARYGLGVYVGGRYGDHFPLGTLMINLLGSFAIGIVFVLVVERLVLHPDWKQILMVGFLGAFTTFSTFSLETVNLLANGYPGTAFAYVLASVTGSLAATWLALSLTRLF